MGHSLGGPIACRLAAENPDAVGGLISAGGSLDPDQEEIREAIEELREMSR